MSASIAVFLPSMVFVTSRVSVLPARIVTTAVDKALSLPMKRRPPPMTSPMTRMRAGMPTMENAMSPRIARLVLTRRTAWMREVHTWMVQLMTPVSSRSMTSAMRGHGVIMGLTPPTATYQRAQVPRGVCTHALFCVGL